MVTAIDLTVQVFEYRRLCRHDKVSFYTADGFFVVATKQNRKQMLLPENDDVKMHGQHDLELVDRCDPFQKLCDPAVHLSRLSGLDTTVAAALVCPGSKSSLRSTCCVCMGIR